MVDASGTVRLANPRAAEMFGYTPSEMVGRSIETLVPLALRKRHAELREHYQKTLTPRPMGQGMALSGERSDGSTFPIEVGLSPINTADGPMTLAYVTDISGRKAQEAMLIQAAKFAAIGELAGNIAHEINNPLGIISAKARLLLSQVEAGAAQTERLRSELEKIVAQCDRLSTLTRNLLDFARPSAGRRDKIDLHIPLRAALAFVRDRVASDDVELCERLEAANAVVLGNDNELQQIFLNLFLNALDAMPLGGRLTVLTEPAEHLGTAAVCVRVCDTGHGIHENIRDRIFEPFYTTKPAGGTGLGLSICRSLVEAHGGYIRLDSRVGEGTDAVVLLPLAEASQ